MGDYGIAGLWLLLALSLVAAVAVAAASIWLADRTLPKPVSEGHNGALSPFLTCVGLVYGALLGFVIVVAWEQFSSAEANVSNEASTVITMYRQTVGMPVPEQTQMRELLRKYAKAVEGPNGRTQYAPAVEPKVRETHSTRCTGCSAVSSQASGRARSVRNFSTS
jgi:hypothetical protein